MATITEWLASLGLSEYAARFAENDIDIDVLPEVTDQDLEQLGISLGHRRRILRAIRDLGATTAAPLRPAAAPEPKHRDDPKLRHESLDLPAISGNAEIAAGRLDILAHAGQTAPSCEALLRRSNPIFPRGSWIASLRSQ